MTTAELILAYVQALREYNPVDPLIAQGLAWLQDQKLQLGRLPGWVKKNKCNECSGEFFWAARKTKGAKILGTTVVKDHVWIPIVPIPVVSEFIILDTVSIDFQDNDKPWIHDATPGIQWFPHRVLCGLRDRPVDSELAEIWEQTVGKELKDEEDAVVGLLGLLSATEDENEV